MAGPRRDRSKFTGSWAGFDDCRHRPTDPVVQAGRHHRPAAVDIRRIYAGPGRLHDSGRGAGRSPRPPADAPGCAFPLRCLLGRGQPDDYRRRADLDAGWLLTHYDWGSIFLINGPVVLLALLGVRIFIPESRDSHASRLDVVGAALVVAGVTGLVYGIIEQPALGWTNATVLASFVTGAILLAGFSMWELRVRSPLVDLRLFLIPRFTWSVLVGMVMGFALIGVLFVFTPFLQIVQGNDAQATGVRLLPLIGGIVLGAVGSDRLVARLGVRVMLVLGLLICAAGMALLSLVRADTGYSLIAIALPVIGVGNAFAMFTSLNVILGVLPEAQTGGGSALTRTLQQLAASFGVAILGSMLNNAYRAQLAQQLTGLPDRLRDVAEGSVAGATLIAAHLPGPLGIDLIHAAHDAYAVGMTDVLRVSAAVMVAGALAIGVFMPARTKAAQEQIEAPEGAYAEAAMNP